MGIEERKNILNIKEKDMEPKKSTKIDYFLKRQNELDKEL